MQFGNSFNIAINQGITTRNNTNKVLKKENLFFKVRRLSRDGGTATFYLLMSVEGPHEEDDRRTYNQVLETMCEANYCDLLDSWMEGTRSGSAWTGLNKANPLTYYIATVVSL